MKMCHMFWHYNISSDQGVLPCQFVKKRLVLLCVSQQQRYTKKSMFVFLSGVYMILKHVYVSFFIDLSFSKFPVYGELSMQQLISQWIRSNVFMFYLYFKYCSSTYIVIFLCVSNSQSIISPFYSQSVHLTINHTN